MLLTQLPSPLQKARHPWVPIRALPLPVRAGLASSRPLSGCLSVRNGTGIRDTRGHCVTAPRTGPSPPMKWGFPASQCRRLHCGTGRWPPQHDMGTRRPGAPARVAQGPWQEGPESGRRGSALHEGVAFACARSTAWGWGCCPPPVDRGLPSARALLCAPESSSLRRPWSPSVPLSLSPGSQAPFHPPGLAQTGRHRRHVTRAGRQPPAYTMPDAYSNV